MWSVFKALCHKYIPDNKVKVIPTTQGFNWRQLRSFDHVVMGGGSLLCPYYVNQVYRAVKLKIPVTVWGSGIDRIGRKSMNAMLTQPDQTANVLSANLAGKLKVIMSNASAFGVRGPLTHFIMKGLKTAAHKVHISGDPGLFIHDQRLFNYRTQPSIPFSLKTPCIAVNWGTTYNQLYGGNELLLRKHLAAALQSLCDQGYDILLYSVWHEDIPSLKMLNQQINRNNQVQTWLKPSVEQLLEVLPQCEYSINFKLHANVLSLAAGTPSMALGYRFKVYDFFHSIDLPQLVLPSHSATLEKEILKLHAYIKENRTLIQKTYEAHEKTYKKRIENLFLNITSNTEMKTES